MVRKRGPLDRIEKVMKKKRLSNSSAGASGSSSPRSEKSMLNAHILNLYKSEIAANEESYPKSSCSSVKEDSSNVIRKSGEEIKKSQNTETSKSKTVRKEKNLERKKSSVLAPKHSTLSFKDVGGLDKVLTDILDLFLHLRDPEVFTNLGISPAGGFLLHGPPGCGKTHLVRAIAGELSLPYIEVAATELVCGISGESESKIRDLFDEAVKSAPCILFIDEIDAISPKRETTERGMERRMVAQLLKCLDELKERDISTNVMVIGATNRPESMDPALRRGGRFDTEFAIGMPNESARIKILEVLCRKLKLASEFDMPWLAHHTPGFLGADLESLIAKAVKVGLKRIYKDLMKKCPESQVENSASGDLLLHQLEKKNDNELSLDSALKWFKSDWKIPEEELENLCFELQDFQVALPTIVPYAKREGFATVPGVTWQDVGALENIKEELMQDILNPVESRKMYEKNGMCSPKGILLYGPKGCGKTLLAKAIANECSINFLSVKGPEFLSMYLGESEKAIRQCFQRARDSAPCVIFFDEMDAICPSRSSTNVNAAADRVVNQLLTEMDGVELRNDVYVIGATNRLDKIDSAMLRPGRLDKAIYVGLPSPDDRVKILKSLTKNKTRPKISDEVDLQRIAFDPRCEHFSGADLESLVYTAFSYAVKEYFQSSCTSTDVNVELRLEHFEFALKKVEPSNTKEDREYFKLCQLQRS